jgi:hypothetical protein
MVRRGTFTEETLKMSCDGKDLIRPMVPLPNGCAVISRHRPDHTVVTALAVPPVAGRPLGLGDEYVSIRDLGDGSYEVTDSYVHAASGPAQVATEAYRSGWERTFNAPGGDA